MTFLGQKSVFTSDELKIVSCNVESLSKVWKSGFNELVKVTSPDIICVQESLSKKEEFPSLENYKLDGYRGIFYRSELNEESKSGTIIFTKIRPISIKSVGENERDGRILKVEFPNFVIITLNSPNIYSKTKNGVFYQKVIEFISEIISSNQLFIICGTLNVCNQEIDASDPKDFENTSIFSDEGKDFFDKLLQIGIYDVYRQKHPNLQQFTYFIGSQSCRVDYFLAPSYLTDSFIEEVSILNNDFSNHSPISIIINRENVFNDIDLDQIALTGNVPLGDADETYIDIDNKPNVNNENNLNNENDFDQNQQSGKFGINQKKKTRGRPFGVNNKVIQQRRKEKMKIKKLLEKEKMEAEKERSETAQIPDGLRRSSRERKKVELEFEPVKGQSKKKKPITNDEKEYAPPRTRKSKKKC